MLLSYPTILVSLAAAGHLTSANAAAAAATIYSVVTSNTSPVETTEVHGTTVIKPVATLESGSVTQYAEVVVQSLIIVHPPAGNTDGPETLLTQPVTFTSTFDQGSATIRFHQPAETDTLAPGFVYENEDRTRNCSIDTSKLEGSCVEVLELVALSGTKTSTATSTTTFSGSLLPIATIGAESSGIMSRKLCNGLFFGAGLLATIGLTFGL
ncbi:hypothetical protein D9619_007567 [Psilocybe cf. subviscida]|uniref:Uncharacterized protein n=1 Tax=Psilocybe cf. subviscida TaxID=2480587 RepID=A0A8H5EWV2_9AGAR|nr:hypothetical protein D9619_007567 [Psilocybe cf. subviscida]